MNDFSHGPRSRLLILLTIIGLLSCNVFSTSVIATNEPTIMPTFTPISQGLTLSSIAINEINDVPAYTISAQIPVLTGSNDPHVVEFNQRMEVLVNQDVDSFRESLVGVSSPPISTGSSFDLKYTLVSPWSEILSLKFVIDSYHDGAAHPFQYSWTFTFDLGSGHQVNLDQLFLPRTNYLPVLADMCKSELTGRDISFEAFITGADPSPENYRNWNISADGLVITFDQYQVAAGAAGPQVVILPWASLVGIIDSQGPLSGFIP